MQRILIVDDTPENLDVLRGILQEDYTVNAAISAKQALKILSKIKPDIILLDVMMPEMDGYELCEVLKRDPLTRAIPVIFVTAKDQISDETKGFELGAVDYITKPVSPPIVRARVSTHLRLYDQKVELERLVQERTAELANSRLDVISKLGRAAEYKDNETGMHVIRMSHFSRFIAEEMGADDKWCELLFCAAPMHDIGKIGIADNILLSPGKLEGDDWEEMKRHVEYGADILSGTENELLHLAREIALNHHEKWDGTGYPNGLKGKDIPLSARIVALADVFDALTSDRPYKVAWSEEKTLEFIKEQSGTHFDPELCDVFERTLPRVREIQQKFRDTQGH